MVMLLFGWKLLRLLLCIVCMRYAFGKRTVVFSSYLVFAFLFRLCCCTFASCLLIPKRYVSSSCSRCICAFVWICCCSIFYFFLPYTCLNLGETLFSFRLHFVREICKHQSTNSKRERIRYPKC